ncbi:hypothetical protein Q4566_12165 [Tamlana sp. 2_MG-2023]|uniref:hypothetical protein n=1 Tax=unclassified Tamlana TaxID=2614803 RepID=UPI0026E22875|nr:MULTISPECIES: hypothetical protein [unclassified Tamlana]MDO6760959.1 hypothetical protein [Tamlana sp. 2_MG-2023]MDO6791215.1 hypothetical protein [Tamlana sp. 1_MG-2023]
MKKLVVVITFLSLNVMNIAAQDVVFDFENVQKEWWTKYKEIWSVSIEKAAEGTKSLKFSCSDFPAGANNIQIQNNDVKLSPGTYTITSKIFIEEHSKVVGLSINLKKPFVKTSIKLNKVPTNQWVSISEEILVEKESSVLIISVSTNPKWGGTGTFYLDDFKITSK